MAFDQHGMAVIVRLHHQPRMTDASLMRCRGDEHHMDRLLHHHATSERQINTVIGKGGIQCGERMAVHIKHAAQQAFQHLGALMQNLVEAERHHPVAQGIHSGQGGKMAAVDKHQALGGGFDAQQLLHPLHIQRELSGRSQLKLRFSIAAVRVYFHSSSR